MLELKHITYTVSTPEGEQTILNDISIDIPDRKLIVFTGPNGGGKTTLAKVIMGLVQPTEGRVIYNGQDVTDLSITERARLGISYGFQQPPRFKGMTVKRLLSLAAGRELDDTTCCELLSSVGLCAKEYINREADATLSGGEMKRIEIATVLAKDHKICVFDEPEAGIDLWSFSMLIKRFEQIHKEKKQSLILISHQERIIRMADRIMVIGDGKVEAVGTADEIVPILFGKKPESCGCRIQKGGELYER